MILCRIQVPSPECAMTIRPDLTVNALVRDRPETLAVLARAGIDACCGGGQTLERAAADAGIAWTELVGRLEAAGRPGSDVPPASAERGGHPVAEASASSEVACRHWSDAT
jgi:hypothetical protein